MIRESTLVQDNLRTSDFFVDLRQEKRKCMEKFKIIQIIIIE